MKYRGATIVVAGETVGCLNAWTLDGRGPDGICVMHARVRLWYPLTNPFLILEFVRDPAGVQQLWEFTDCQCADLPTTEPKYAGTLTIRYKSRERVPIRNTG